jgi:hypothetical protein
MFLAGILDLPAPSVLGPLAVVRVGDTSPHSMEAHAFMGADGEIVRRSSRRSS